MPNDVGWALAVGIGQLFMEITFPRRGASEEAIRELETRIGAELSPSYKDFLRSYNGGKPTPACFKFARGSLDMIGVVDWFLSLGNDPDCDLETNRQIYAGRIPADCMPIAYDPGGNLVIASISGPRRDDLLFWNHEGESNEGQPASEDNIYRICKGSGTFLGSLTGCP